MPMHCMPIAPRPCLQGGVYSWDLVPGPDPNHPYVRLESWEFSQRDSHTIITVEGGLTFESPSSVRPLYAKVSGYVSVPPSYAETDTPETSDDGKTWQLSITSDQSLDFGAGLEMFDIKGIMSRKTDGTLNTRIWTASTVTDPIVFVPQLFELRTYVMSSEITAYPPTGPDICVQK